MIVKNRCPVCGTVCEVVGDVTLHYAPVRELRAEQLAAAVAAVIKSRYAKADRLKLTDAWALFVGGDHDINAQ